MVFMDAKQNLSPSAKEILDLIETSEATKEGKGMIVVLGFPSTNEVTVCVFSLRNGTTVNCKRDEFVAALAELIQAGSFVSPFRALCDLINRGW
jgi:hypothetical protein